MFYEYYIISMLSIMLCGLLCGLASAKVSKAYNKYGGISTRSRMTGYDTARRLLNANDVRDISIGRVRGSLTDHYHPSKKIVNSGINPSTSAKYPAPIIKKSSPKIMPIELFFFIPVTSLTNILYLSLSYKRFGQKSN